ncbi:MAG: hypothetical protein COB08_016480 [Rhodobacteraceae bacterium]|nr:hypothetical protein [Paracoccaceae bacterium]
MRIGDDKSVAQNSILLFARSESELMPNVNPESQQALIDFIESSSDEGEIIELSVKSGRNENTMLEGIEEIKKYASAIKMPIHYNTRNFELTISRSNGAVFTYSPANKFDSDKAINHLLQFRPWYHGFTNTFAFFFAFLVTISNLFFETEIVEFISNQTTIHIDKIEPPFSNFSFVMAIFLLLNLAISNFSTSIRFEIYQGFFRRHFDTIVVGTILAFLAVMVGKLF